MIIDELILLIKSKLDTASQKKVDAGIDKSKEKMKGLGKASKNAMTKQQKAVKSVVSSFSSSLPFVGGMIDALNVKSLKVLGIIAGIIVAIKGISVATKKYLAFEQGMKEVQMIMLTDDDTMKKLENSALKEASGSIFDSSQVASAQKFLAQAGLEVDEVISALPHTLQLASASNMDLARASDISTDIMTAQGLAVEDLVMVNDSLVKGANLATISAEKLGLAMGKVGGEAKRSNISVQLLSASLGVIASSGAKVEGGTFFRNMLVELRGKKVKKAMKSVGLDIANYINEGTGEYTDFVGLMKAMGKLDKVQSNTLMTEGFATSSRGKRALLALIDNADKLEGNYAKIMDASGVAQDASRIAFKGLGGEWKQSSSILEVASVLFMKNSGLITIFTDTVDVLATALASIITLLAPLVRFLVLTLTIWLKAWKVIFKVLGGFVTIIGKGLGFVLTPFTEMLNVLGNVFERVASGIEVITDNFDMFGDSASGVSSKVEFMKDAFKNMIHETMVFLNPILELLDLWINAVLFDNDSAKIALQLYLKEFKKIYGMWLDYAVIQTKDAFTGVFQDLTNWLIQNNPFLGWIKPITDLMGIDFQKIANERFDTIRRGYGGKASVDDAIKYHASTPYHGGGQSTNVNLGGVTLYMTEDAVGDTNAVSNMISKQLGNLLIDVGY